MQQAWCPTHLVYTSLELSIGYVYSLTCLPRAGPSVFCGRMADAPLNCLRIIWATQDNDIGDSAIASSPACSCSLSASILADRKSTRLNSSHLVISYAVFCLEKIVAEIEVEKRFGPERLIVVRTAHLMERAGAIVSRPRQAAASPPGIPRRDAPLLARQRVL